MDPTIAPPEGSPAAGFLMLTSLLFLAGVAGTLALRGSAFARVGEPLHVHRSGGPYRLLRSLPLAALAIAAILVPGAPTLTGLLVLLLALGLVLLTPGPEDSAVGADGVRAGWEAARYDELEEWRLTGEHLRWRKRGGAWVSSRLPAELQAPVRERLTAVAPDRESRFAS